MKPINPRKLELFHQGLKSCRTCKEVKQHSEFSKQSKAWDKLHDQCKSCKISYEKSKRVIKYPPPPDGFRLCRRCNIVKPLDDFNKGPQRQGTQAKCRECQKKINQQYSSSEAGRKKHKQWEQSEVGRLAFRDYAIKAREKSPDAYKAHNAVNNAVRDGKLPRVKTLSCAKCGVPAKHYHHYAGYAPENHLTVEPLCITCHKKLDS